MESNEFWKLLPVTSFGGRNTKESRWYETDSIPTIADRIAQMVARMYVEPVVELMFCEDSYGYKPNKSAIDAVATARRRCWKYDYVIELDVKGLRPRTSDESSGET